MSEKQKKLNISLTGDVVDEINELKIKLDKELSLNLSAAQIVKRLIKQALATHS